MAEFVVVNKEQLESGLGIVADAIREKGGTSEPLAFPNGMKEAVMGIQSGGGLPSWLKELEVIELTVGEDTNEERTFEYILENMPNLIIVLSDFTKRENARDFVSGVFHRVHNNDSLAFDGHLNFANFTEITSVGANCQLDSTNVNNAIWSGVADVTNKSFLLRTYSYGGTYCYWRVGHTYKIIVAKVGV